MAGDRHSGRGGDHRQPPFLPAGERAVDELPLDLQPDQQKEQGHQAVVYPEMDGHWPELRRKDRTGLHVQQVAVGVAEGTVGENQRQCRRRHEQQTARRLAVEKVAQRGAPAGPAQPGRHADALAECRSEIERSGQILAFQMLHDFRPKRRNVYG
jgi:hypothetical protein